MNIKEIIKDNTVHFSNYKKGFFYYSIVVKEEIYTFPIPIEGIGDATLKDQDKAIIFMRWIRKAIEDKTFLAC